MVLGATVGLRASTARAQSSSCVDCHYANPDAPCHLSEWKRSAHGRHDVGCEKCHGGDPTVYDAFRAHLGILGSRNPSSPVNRVNLPRTCGQVRQSLDRARELLHRVKDKKPRAQLEAAYTQAEVPLTEAVNEVR